jgi:hypothetical protein
MSFCVRIVNDDQEPVKGARVGLGFTSVLRGMASGEYTDSDGCAYFDGYDDGECEVFVNGRSEGRHYYRDGDSVTVSV